MRRFSHLASELGIGQTQASDLSHGELKAVSIIQRIVFGSDFPSCILFRDPDLVKAEHYHAALVQVLTVAESEIEKGCVIIVRRGRLRVRTLPLLRPQS